MKFSTPLVSALCVASATARSSLFSSSAAVAPFDANLSVPGENPLQHCADPKDDILLLKSVDLTPNPPAAGAPLAIVASGILSKNVTEGAKIHLTVKYGLITIIKQTADLCEQVKQVDLECPLQAGNEVKLSKDVELPKQIPPGKYTVVADVVTIDDEKITCLSATVEFKRGGAIVINGEEKGEGYKLGL